MYYLPRIYK